MRSFICVLLNLAIATKIKPFRIAVPDEILSDLNKKLETTRFPVELDGWQANWTLGPPTKVMQDIVSYWRTKFNWRAQEAKLNEMPQFTTEIDGVDIHFVHIRGKVSPGGAPGIPLLFVHGWPGSFWECSRIAPLLTQGSEQVYDLVCPSLPGFGFTTVPKRTGYDPVKCADLLVELMKRLGYPRFITQGGDWGSIVTTTLAHRHPTNVAAIHLNFFPVSLPFRKGVWTAIKTVFCLLRPRWCFEDNEAAIVESVPRIAWEETGYFHLQATRPHTLGFGITDSPVGLCAWFAEKFQLATDEAATRADMKKAGRLGDYHGLGIPTSEFLTNVMIYWVTNTATSSARFYHEFMAGEGLKLIDRFDITMPAAFAIFPKEVRLLPKAFVEPFFPKLVQWTQFEKGGHFAAMEQPHLLVGDVRNFTARLSLEATRMKPEL